MPSLKDSGFGAASYLATVSNPREYSVSSIVDFTSCSVSGESDYWYGIFPRMSFGSVSDAAVLGWSVQQGTRVV
jgi:hypothetical protein